MTFNLIKNQDQNMTCLQKTSLTIRGMFLEGFRVSPAVIPKLSVPPTKTKNQKYRICISEGSLTCKASGHEHSGKTAKTTNKRGTRYCPITDSDESAFRVEANIDQHSNDYEEDYSYNLQR